MGMDLAQVNVPVLFRIVPPPAEEPAQEPKLLHPPTALANPTLEDGDPGRT